MLDSSLDCHRSLLTIDISSYSHHFQPRHNSHKHPLTHNHKHASDEVTPSMRASVGRSIHPLFVCPTLLLISLWSVWTELDSFLRKSLVSLQIVPTTRFTKSDRLTNSKSQIAFILKRAHSCPPLGHSFTLVLVFLIRLFSTILLPRSICVGRDWCS
ncbi:hypothetical protein BLNAU_16351 [Blattamonas nauphoetae]|uniref:Uncharacterized protein n=1 Tax=Blattamonas nauphoetae TaxID=2049346 RepID=A0ABQ9X8D0_9EUKA|nr:hypothetical protein BLNAU_16351 [Blattamonas nauphoetae]